MICTKCGASINDTDTVCPNCNSMIMQVHEVNENINQNNEWDKYNLDKEQMSLFNFNSYLIWSIVTCLCCVPLGLVNILLLEFYIKPLIKEGNVDKASKMKPLLILLIILGFVGSLLINFFPILIFIIPMIAIGA